MMRTETIESVSRAFALALLVDGPQILELIDHEPWQTSARHADKTSLAMLIALEDLARRPVPVAEAVAESARRTGTDPADLEREFEHLREVGILGADGGSSLADYGDLAPEPTPESIPDAPLLLATPMVVGLDHLGYALVDSAGVLVARFSAVDVLFHP